MLGCKGWNEGESFEPVTNKFLVVTRAMSFKAWMVESYLQILQYLGRAPKDMDKLTSKLKTLHELDAIAAERAKRTVSVSWFRSPSNSNCEKSKLLCIKDFNRLQINKAVKIPLVAYKPMITNDPMRHFWYIKILKRKLFMYQRF